MLIRWELVLENDNIIYMLIIIYGLYICFVVWIELVLCGIIEDGILCFM